MKWEYRIEQLGGKSGVFQTRTVNEINRGLAKLGEDGWELVGVIPAERVAEAGEYGVATEDALVFKRPRE